jgi:hypothetical protein
MMSSSCATRSNAAAAASRAAGFVGGAGDDPHPHAHEQPDVLVPLQKPAFVASVQACTPPARGENQDCNNGPFDRYSQGESTSYRPGVRLESVFSSLRTF